MEYLNNFTRSEIIELNLKNISKPNSNELFHETKSLSQFLTTANPQTTHSSLILATMLKENITKYSHHKNDKFNSSTFLLDRRYVLNDLGPKVFNQDKNLFNPETIAPSSYVLDMREKSKVIELRSLNKIGHERRNHFKTRKCTDSIKSYITCTLKSRFVTSSWCDENETIKSTLCSRKTKKSISSRVSTPSSHFDDGQMEETSIVYYPVYYFTPIESIIDIATVGNPYEQEVYGYYDNNYEADFSKKPKHRHRSKTRKPKIDYYYDYIKEDNENDDDAISKTITSIYEDNSSSEDLESRAREEDIIEGFCEINHSNRPIDKLIKELENEQGILRKKECYNRSYDRNIFNSHIKCFLLFIFTLFMM